MIVIYHNQHKITEVYSSNGNNFADLIGQKITFGLLTVASQFADDILVWCCQTQKDNLNLKAIDRLFHHPKFIFSYSTTQGAHLDQFLGYVEATPYLNINKKVSYGTWQMSSEVGAIHARVLLSVKDQVQPNDTFDYFLNSLAKLAMPYGLLCYSEPELLKDISQKKTSVKPDYFELFRFVKQHYKMRWVLFLFLNLIYFEKRFLLIPFIYSFSYRKRRFNPAKLNAINLQSKRNIIEHNTIDVLIPTIGRKKYLFDVLNHLAQQTHLPTNVIIIEQNPEPESISELDYITQNQWPFHIKHTFTHQAGACNARNIGLKLIESEFCFLADDDVVFDTYLIENAMRAFQTIANEVFLVACHLKDETIQSQAPRQFPAFGSGVAFVKSACLKDLIFRNGYEFGFGEDIDFGMQLRKKGYDIIYLSTFKILHLKAPMGGFRTKPILPWHNETYLPKPSPTVMLYKLLHNTPEQFNSYKTTLFFNTLDKNFWFNPFKGLNLFRKKWNLSVYWAKQLIDK